MGIGRYSQKTVIRGKGVVDTRKFIKDGHIVCPFEGYELLHDKPKVTVDENYLRSLRRFVLRDEI